MFYCNTSEKNDFVETKYFNLKITYFIKVNNDTNYLKKT